jgi:4-hydroxybenzoyl-CoA thioesterase
MAMSSTTGAAVGRHTIQVGWGDVDPAEIVFFPRYFEWLEIGTGVLFESVGLPLHRLFKDRGILGIALVDVGARFHFPCKWGDRLEMESRVAEWRTKSFRVEHKFFRDGKLAAEGYEVRVWAMRDPTGERPMRAGEIPADIMTRFGHTKTIA